MSKGAKTILLVEDNEDDVVFMRRALKNAEVTNPVHVTRDGQEAIDYLTELLQVGGTARPELPLFVLLDLKLPRRNGLEVLQWIRQERRLATLIVIILSTSREENDISRAYAYGANAYLVKPTAVSELVEMMKGVKSFWLTYNTFS